MMKQTLLTFDIGGSKIRICVSHDGKTLSETAVHPTPKKFVDGIHLFHAVAEELAHGRAITGVAGGIAGPLDSKKTMLVNSPNIPGWIRKPLVPQLQKTFHCPVILGNDAELCGLGEAHFGAGKGSSILAYITVSTGVGGSRIVDGKIDRSAMGFEPGHQVIGIRKDGELEHLVGGKRFERKYHKKPYEVHSRVIWTHMSEILARGLINVCVFWSPDRIVIGGSMIKQPGILFPVVNAYLKKNLKIFPLPPKVIPAKLGDFGGLYGGLALAGIVKESTK